MKAACLAVLCLSASASAGAAFSIGAVDASDGTVPGGRPGTGIDVIGGTIFQHPSAFAGATDEPNRTGPFFPPLTIIFDTYLTVDRGPNEFAPGYSGQDVGPATEASGSPSFTDTNYRGAWYVTGPFINAFEAYNKPEGAWQLFLGRITHTGTLSGKIAVAIAEENSPGFTTIEGDIVTEDNIAAGLITHDVDGALLVKPQVTPDRGYAFVAKQFEVVIGSTTYTVTDIFLQNVVIPTPGAMGLLGVAGVAAVRRRRR